MKRKWLILQVYLIFCQTTCAHYDVSIVGYVGFSYSLGRLTTSMIDCLKDDLKVNFIDSRPHRTTLADVPESVKRVFNGMNSKEAGEVAIFTDHLWMPSTGYLYKKVPNSRVKIAYTMVESTKIPLRWVEILNNEFDMAVVPDEWLVSVYEESGVVIPIFVLPPCLYLDDFLAFDQSKRSSDTFTFGIASGFLDNKNIPLLVEAFAQEFENDKKVRLCVHSIHGKRGGIRNLRRFQNSANIEFNTQAIPWTNYVDFIAALDCYVLISKGEGFSITPRESLAAGVPCILSNNTAHIRLCNKPFVKAVPAERLNNAAPGSYGEGNVGMNFECDIRDVRAALREVYENYYHYRNAAKQDGRMWVQRYCTESLGKRYITMCKPKSVVLGEKNVILNDCLTTNSPLLYNKYKIIIEGKETDNA